MVNLFVGFQGLQLNTFMIIYSIYKFVNRVNGKYYIGFTKDFPARLRGHRSRYTKLDTTFYHALRKYGWDNFDSEIIYQSLDEDHCHNVMEEYFIREYRSHVDEGCGYNQSYGGDGQRGYDARTRWKLGSANRGKKRGPTSEETKRKIGEANSKKRRTEEEKQHLREVNLGKKQSEASRIKRSKSYRVFGPSGQVFDIVNLLRFCQDHGLNQGAMAAVARGEKTAYTGWRCEFSPV